MLCIGIDARELVGQPAGKGQYLKRILESWLQQTDVSLKLILYIQEGHTLELTSSQYVNVVMQPQKGRAVLWHRNVSKRLVNDGVAVFFAPFSYQSAIWNSVPTVTTVHDLAIFLLPGVSHNRRAQLIEKIFLKRCIRKSAALIAVSQSTAHDLVQVSAVSPKKIIITPLAPLLEPAEALPLAKRNAYFLFVGTLEPRKNIPILLQAYALLSVDERKNHPLMLAGKPGWGGENYQQMARELAIETTVQFLGYVPNEKLIELYKHAYIFVYPSLYEGFGLPVVEAMAYGTPVITSNTSSLPEVVGDAGVLCDPADAQALSFAMKHYLQDEDFWQQKSTAALTAAKKFTWEATAKTTLAMLENVSQSKN